MFSKRGKNLLKCAYPCYPGKWTRPLIQTKVANRHTDTGNRGAVAKIHLHFCFKKKNIENNHILNAR